MSLYAVVRNAYNPETQEFDLTEDTIEREGHLDGNLCRCTGYKPILQAAKTFVTEDLKGRLAAEKESSKTHAVEIDLTDASPKTELKDAYPSAKLVGGASEVQVEVRFKGSDFAVSVYVSDIEELQETRLPKSEAEWDSMTEIYLGANTPLSELEHVCKAVYDKLGQRALALEALRKQLRYFAGRQIRNVASLAGNVATASPISDGNPVLLAAGADVMVRSKQGGSVALPMSEFFLAYRTTTLPPDAIITHVRVPLPRAEAREITKAYKQAKRKDDDIAIVTSAYRVRLDDRGVVTDICLAYGGMAPTTIEAKGAKKALVGKRWFDSTTLEAGMDALAADFNLPFGVPGGMAHYRRALAVSLFFRFWHEVVAELGLGEVDEDLIQEIHREISSGTRDNYNPHEQRVVGKQVPHLSALKQCTGEAQYVDDIERQDRELYGAMVMSSRAHAKLVEVDWTPALSMPGVVGYIDKDSLPKEANIWGSVKKDETFFADGEVLSHGHTIGMIYAETALQAQAAARVVKVVYEDLPAILTIDEAIEANSFFAHGKQLKKGLAIQGKMDETFAKCDRIFTGVTRVGGQEHFYLETNAALAIPHKEDGSMEVWSSTQNTTETQEFVSQVLGVPSNRINARVKRMGGAFGGKESRSVPIACLCAIAARNEGRPVRVMLNRDEDMMTTGQRHPIQARWKVGTTADGKLLALDADVYDNAGYSQDMSGAVMDRCCTHLENCYNVPDAHIRGHVCRTNIHSNTAFRGFGGPQAMYIAEQIMYAIAEETGFDIDELRVRNLYQIGDRTPFLQQIDEDWHIPTMLDQLKKSADFEARKTAIQEFNRTHRWKKRGISLIPSKFGLSFATALHLNQAGAYVKVYADGSVLLHHGGTEMGQGLYTKMCQVAAQALGVPLDAVFNPDSQSYQIANASPTAASSGSDLNGMAVKNACDQLNERLGPYWEKYGKDAEFKTIAHAAYIDRVNLAANGFWKMPRIGYVWGEYDVNKVKDMYYYFTQGVACSSVELDLLTGDHTVLRTDILMDVGQSINPGIDYGQIEGAFVQGVGLFTIEESLWHAQSGQLATRGPGNYKIPGFSDIPQVFNAAMLRVDGDGKPLTWKHLRSVQSSKGIGEPPLFLGATVFFALREAVRAARRDNELADGKLGERFCLESPATAEKLRLAVGDAIVKRTAVKRKEGETPFFVTVA
ncbi:putative xanthine dehydrogenase [Diplodia seriata]|uniref:Putative xanthine dehydrogenase n=1 Tax=Diplodia seriata TaxID=420778 RepID=A0A0G2GRT6_9PEZI|nr:putative xanthine dehydrogenase [Diplodia seriata]